MGLFINCGLIEVGGVNRRFFATASYKPIGLFKPFSLKTAGRLHLQKPLHTRKAGVFVGFGGGFCRGTLGGLVGCLGGGEVD